MTMNTQGQFPFKRIYLIGMMGAGKSAVAALLAKELDWLWMETDACIVRNSCLSIPELFVKYGEDEFRKREWECVRQTVKFENLVIACGGGAPCFYNAIELMRSNGLVIYLSASVHTLTERLASEASSRPMLTSETQSIEERIESLLGTRTAVYNTAHLTIETDGLNAAEVARILMQKLVEAV